MRYQPPDRRPGESLAYGPTGVSAIPLAMMFAPAFIGPTVPPDAMYPSAIAMPGYDVPAVSPLTRNAPSAPVRANETIWLCWGLSNHAWRSVPGARR